MQTTIVTCANPACGRQFERALSKVRKAPGRQCCSPHCAAVFGTPGRVARRVARGETAPTVPCVTCGRPVKVRRGRKRQCCSKACWYTWQRTHAAEWARESFGRWR